jgi:FkbM family methyltransferase
MLTFDDNTTAAQSDEWFWERVSEAIAGYPVLNLANTQFQARILGSHDAEGTVHTTKDHMCPALMESFLLCQGWQLPLTIVDIGANVGAFTWLATMMGEDVYAYEPAQETFERLQENIKKYSLNADNVNFFRNAVAAESGQVVQLGKSSTSSFSGDATTVGPAGQDAEEVTTVSLEDVIARTPRKKIDYLKIDCEGAEYDFLLGKDLTSVGFIALELHEIDGRENLIQLAAHIEKTHDIKWLADHNIFATNKLMKDCYGYLGTLGYEQHFGPQLTFDSSPSVVPEFPTKNIWTPLSEKMFNQLNPDAGTPVDLQTMGGDWRQGW